MERGRASGVVAACALLLIACTDSTASTSTSRPVDRDLVTELSSHCTDLNSPDLGEGTLCIDNGFRMKSDDFSFANWGRSPRADDNVTVQTLVDLFGHRAVCMPGSLRRCVMRPGATQKLEEWNIALAGGRCEGLAALSTRLFLRYDDPADFDPTAGKVSDLDDGDPMLSRSIVYWWSTQFLQEVADRAGESRTKSPLRLVDDLIQGLAHGVGYTLGLYSGPSGHSVTPFAVTKRGDSFIVHVYDNNHPGVRREIEVDSTDDTWSYRGAFTGIDGNPIDWRGSRGSFELTPMSSRQGPFTCPFCTGTQVPDTVVTVASQSATEGGFVSVTTRDGASIVASPDGIVNTIPGATYAIGKGNTGGLATITLPPSTGDFDVAVRRRTRDVPAGDVTVSIRRPGAANLQVTGNLAQSPIGSTPVRALLSVRSDATTINAPDTSIARVSVAAGSTLSRSALQPGGSLVVTRITGDSIDVSLKGANAARTVTRSVSAREDTAVTELTLSLDGSGSIVVDDRKVVAVSVEVTAPVRFTPSTRRPAARPTTTTTAGSSITISQPD